MTYLAGIDLAWRPDRNATGWAVGRLDGGVLTLECLETGVVDVPGLAQEMLNIPDLTGIAIDAPLVVRNDTGRRPCEADLSRDYQRRNAGCHSTNRSLYPHLASVEFSRTLEQAGFVHLGQPFDQPWQIEIYPHPALIEIFGLRERLAYKKGSQVERKEGQIALAGLLAKLADSPVLPLEIPRDQRDLVDPERITALTGPEVKCNEDALDAVVCLYLAGLYAIGCPRRLYGDGNEGYIVVPTVRCDRPSAASGEGSRDTRRVRPDRPSDGELHDTTTAPPMDGTALTLPRHLGAPVRAERVEQLLALLARAVNDGRPLLCTPAWAYRRLIGPFDEWSPLHARHVVHAARQSSQRSVKQLGLVHLDAFIVTSASRLPDARHWTTAPYTLTQWQSAFAGAKILD